MAKKDDHDHTKQQDIAYGEDSLTGTQTDLEADDDTLKGAQDAGLYEEADEEHPAEVDIAGQIEKDEKEHQKED